MGSIVGRNVRVEVGKTEGQPIVLTGISKAKPGMASKAAHGLSAKSVGYFTGVTGMVQLDGMAARLGAVTADTFVLEDINTTLFPDFTAGSFVPITAWSTFAKATSYSIGGGAPNNLDDTALLDVLTQQINGLLAAQTVSFNENAEEVFSEAKALIVDAARTPGTYLVFRITLSGGATRVFRAQPGLPGEDVQKGAIGTGTVACTVKGFVTNGAP